MTASDIISNAFLEIGVGAAGETLQSEQSAFGLSKLNRLFDNWNADGDFIFASTLFQGTLTAEKNPHTIGTAGTDFIVTVGRPVRITDANLVLTDVTPNIFRPLKIVDDAWWMQNPVPTLDTKVPYYLYPNFSWPTGQLYLWPVPQTAYDIRLLIDTQIASLALSDTFSMPQGYEDAVTLSLAESLAAAYERPVNPQLSRAAAAARERIKSNNSDTPQMMCDAAAQSQDARPQASIANILSGFFN